MPEFGQFALRLGLLLSGYAILVDTIGRRWNRRELLASGRNATIGCLLCLTAACVALEILLARSDFSVQYVAENTSRALPFVYKLTALWAGAAGSLLLWLWLQTGFVVLAFVKFDRDSDPTRSPAAQRPSGPGTGQFCAAARAAANLVAVFFFLVLIFDKDPFGQAATTPRDGAGLNPLLQHPAMVLHPPALFLGYAAFAIPYAWVFAALRRPAPGPEGPRPEGALRFRASGLRVGDTRQPPILFSLARNSALFAWMFLTVGIALGAWWAYEELGWGGYWAWDPVENASLIPWLTATALLHCARTFRAGTKTGLWFMVLALVTFSLCIFGTFLTRYGLVSSVHAFPEPGLGILFLVLLMVIWAVATPLILRGHRRPGAAAPTQGPGIRFVVWNNWLMVLLAFVVLVGTLFPFFSGLVSREPIVLKSGYFTKITAPGGLVLLLLLGVCPHLMRHGLGKSWRTLGAAVTAIAAVLIWTLVHHLAIAYLVACAFVAINLVADFIQRYAHHGDTGEAMPVRASLRWYGARTVHIGVLLAFVGIAGSGGFDLQKQVALRPGERTQVGDFELAYDGLDAQHGANFTAVKANVSVYRGQTRIAQLAPAVAFYAQSDKRTSEVDVRRTLAGDLYLALTEADSRSKLINLTIYIKPLINWLWIGSGLMVLGTALVLAASLGRTRSASQGNEQ